jgi:hypothetical protein
VPAAYRVLVATTTCGGGNRARPPDTCLIGTHKGVTRRHPAACLDELVFRHNPGSNLAAASRTLPGPGAMREPTNCDMIKGVREIRGSSARHPRSTLAGGSRKKPRPLATTPGTSPE